MIAGVLLAVAKARDEGSTVGGLPQLFRLQTTEMLLSSSRYVPRKKRVLEPAAPTPVRSVDEELRARVRQESAERVARGISRQKIEAWILDVLGQRGSMEIEELLTILREVEDGQQLLYVYLYGHDELARYQLGKHKEIREQDTIRYSNRTLRRREKRK